MMFYTVKVQEDVSLKNGIISFQFWQQGNLLQNYHKKGDERYIPSEFNVVLISMDPECHEVIQSTLSHHSFCPTLLLTQKEQMTLLAGSYLLVVDVRWNRIAEENPVLKRVRMQVAAPREFLIE